MRSDFFLEFDARVIKRLNFALFLRDFIFCVVDRFFCQRNRIVDFFDSLFKRHSFNRRFLFFLSVIFFHFSKTSFERFEAIHSIFIFQNFVRARRSKRQTFEQNFFMTRFIIIDHSTCCSGIECKNRRQSKACHDNKRNDKRNFFHTFIVSYFLVKIHSLSPFLQKSLAIFLFSFIKIFLRNK